MTPHQLVIAADAAGRDDNGLRVQRERADKPARACRPAFGVARLQHVPLHAVDNAAACAESRNAMAEAERHQSAALRLAHAPYERLNHARPGAPSDMKARHRIAVATRKIAATLGPADDRENLEPLLAQPRALLARREIHVGLGPAARPVILVTVESGRAKPVLQRKLLAVADSQPPLFR